MNMLSKSFTFLWGLTISLLGQFWPSSPSRFFLWKRFDCSGEADTGEYLLKNTNQTSVFLIALVIALFLTMLSPAQAASPTVDGTTFSISEKKVEGNHTCTISHAITASADSHYPTTMNINNITPKITDNDPGVIITQTDGSTKVTEGGATDTL